MKRLEFEEYGTQIRVLNRKRKIALGYIEFHKPWKMFIFEPLLGTIYSAGCMQEIVDYMKELKHEDGRK